jgi:hypothetical protein
MIASFICFVFAILFTYFDLLISFFFPSFANWKGKPKGTLSFHFREFRGWLPADICFVSFATFLRRLLLCFFRSRASTARELSPIFRLLTSESRRPIQPLRAACLWSANRASERTVRRAVELQAFTSEKNALWSNFGERYIQRLPHRN